jgi:hypothetical protein
MGKKEKATVPTKKLSWGIISGAVVGLGIGVALTFITDCYGSGALGYSIATALILFATFFGYWVGKNQGFKLLQHEDVYYRVGGYVAFGLILFLCTWAVFFFLVKKPNLLADSFMIQKMFKSDVVTTLGDWGAKTFGSKMGKPVGVWANVLLLTFKYFLNHLIFVIPFIFVLNFFKIGKWNLSAIYFTLYTIMWGAAVGTGPMAFPSGENQMAGSLIVFARYGLWVWFSYLLLLSSTTQFACLAAPSWLGFEWKKERKFWPVSFTPDQREVFIYGMLFLLASSFAEARIFVFYNL